MVPLVVLLAATASTRKVIRILIVFFFVYSVYTCVGVCVLYSNNYMLNMFSMGLMLICINVTSTVMATVMARENLLAKWRRDFVLHSSFSGTSQFYIT